MLRCLQVLAVSRLRSILEPDREGSDREGSDRVIVTHDHGYALKTAPGTIDSDVFAELVAEGSSILRDDPDAASRTIRSALSSEFYVRIFLTYGRKQR